MDKVYLLHESGQVVVVYVGEIESPVVYRDIGALTSKHTTGELAADFSSATIPHAIINTIAQVAGLAALKNKLTTTTIPGGKKIRMQPLAVDDTEAVTELDFPPRYGEHTRHILREVGYTDSDCDKLSADGIIYAATTEPS